MYIAGFLVVCAVLSIAIIISVIWRINLALNHPEKAERLKELEEELTERMQAPYRKMYDAAKPVGRLGMKMLVRRLGKGGR